MNNKAFQFAKRHWIVLILLFIFVGGVFVRVYHFSDWLFFQGDQMRDLLVARKSVEGGLGWLPLLGPKAGGTFLRLGPIFYYFQYLSVSIFGLSPASMAFPDLFFSLLTLPLFFLFAREFFSKKWSLALTAGYATCFFAVQYSRFAWNPNSLPFFNLLFFYALLRFLETKEKGRKWPWSILIGIAYSVASQLHFVSFLSLPIALILIFIFRKIILKEFEIRVALKLVAVVLAVLVIFYIPVILSEISTNWNNSLNFLNSIGSKSSEGTVFSLVKQSVYNFSKYFLIIGSGFIAVPKKIVWIFGALFFSSMLFALFISRNYFGRKERLFLILVFAWFFSYGLVYFPTANDLQPRHFLVILPLPFIFWGIICLALNNFLRIRYINLAIAILLLFPMLSNAFSLKTWFSEISASQVSVSTPRKSGLLKSVGGESWWHLEKSAEFMHRDCEKSKLSIAPPKRAYQSLLDYVMQYVGEERAFKIRWNSVRYDPNTCYYAVNFSRNDYQDRFGKDVEEVRSITFGDIRVIRFEVNQKELNEKNEIRNPFRKENDINPNDNTEDDNNDNKEDAIENGEEEKTFLNIDLSSVGRRERVFWRDFWQE